MTHEQYCAHATHPQLHACITFPFHPATGATKAGITQLTGTLQRELADTPIKLHTVSPGMILTDLLLEGATTANKQVWGDYMH